jgi:formylglycine-generating enzyme required for sulfatase activity
MPSKPHRGPEDPADAFDVFISFARPSGLEYAIALRDALAARGRRAFVDERDVPLGSSWAEVVEERHRWSKFTVAVITADSPGSRWQEAEVTRALAQARAKSGPSHLAYAWPCPGSTPGHIWPDIPGSIALLDYAEGASPAAAATAVARDLAVSLSVLDGSDEPPEPEPERDREPEPEPEPEPKPAAERPRLPPQGPPQFPPAWAVEWGHDDYGPFAGFAVQRVIQRMRWCPPGRFWMGSPTTERGRDPHEGPQHEVTLTRGFWMADTPVTQAMYTAVMGQNPSRFNLPNSQLRPVEEVSWRDAVELTQRLQRRMQELFSSIEGDVFRLPTEAEWDYACRAASTGATYASVGMKLLDIAWVSGDISGSTQPVAQLKPNA